MATVGAIIPAGGSGKRLGADRPKQMLEIGGVPLWLHALRAFALEPAIAETALAVPAASIPEFERALDAERRAGRLPGKVVLAPGGAERWLSVRNALAALSPEVDAVLVHDAAHPFVSARIVRDCVRALERGESFIVARPCVDTVKTAGPDGFVAGTIDRSELRLAQTPQGFARADLEKWFAELDNVRKVAGDSLFVPTDEASIAERFGRRVSFVEGDYLNDKITLPGDLERFEAFWKAGLVRPRGKEKA